MATRVARLQLMNINSVTGRPYLRVSPNEFLPVKGVLSFRTEHRVIEDPNLPNSTGYPTVEEYLNRESGDGLRPVQVDQTMVITTDD